MTNFSLATCFSNRLLKGLDRLNKLYKDRARVVEVFGSLPKSVVGSGREESALPKVSIKGLEDHIKKAHDKGIKFNYLLNASCLGNQEYTQEGQSKIISFLELLVSLKVDSVTVALPFLVRLIRERYPQLPVNISVISYVDSVERALLYQNLGVSRICLDLDINRDFNLIEEIRKRVSVDLEILSNNLCLLRCSLRYSHYNFTAHSTQEGGVPDYPGYPFRDQCSLINLQNLEEFIKSPWVRPEDVSAYTKRGINIIKIGGRELLSPELLYRAKAYMSGSFEGNLATLLCQFQFEAEHEKPLEFIIDNKKLNDFLKFFEANRCSYQKGCRDCNYCREVAKKVLKIDSSLKERYIQILKEKIRGQLYISQKSNLLGNSLGKSSVFSLREKFYSLYQQLFRKVKKFLKS